MNYLSDPGAFKSCKIFFLHILRFAVKMVTSHDGYSMAAFVYAHQFTRVPHFSKRTAGVDVCRAAWVKK